MEDLEFLLDWRALDRGGLQAVAERLVVRSAFPRAGKTAPPARFQS